jgi:hypothetical protein
MRMPLRKLYDVEYDYDTYSDLFPKKADLVEAILVPRTRRGVQVVYGDRPGFINFLKEVNAARDDDYSAKLSVPIPPEFVKVIIPLGSCEQETLERMRVNGI